ncbi:MAG: LytTR family transcriptional regulator [Tannerella sp.]|nr:LytTR family transcriptional regulator [Tannerella sp.]
MDKYLIIKTRDELLRINIEHILYFEADRNYTRLLLAEGIQFTFAVNIGKVEEMLTVQISDPDTVLIRVGKSHIVNKKHILQINLPKQKLLLLANEGKPRELIIPKDPLRTLKDMLEAEVLGTAKEGVAKEGVAKEAEINGNDDEN